MSTAARSSRTASRASEDADRLPRFLRQRIAAPVPLEPDGGTTAGAPLVVHRTPDDPPRAEGSETEPATGESASEAKGGGATTPAACDPTPLSRADYLTKSGTTKQDFGLTSITVSSADMPRVETVRAPGGRGFVVPATPDVMPPIDSVYTKASTFEEGESILFGEGECPGGRKYPIRWTITASGAGKIRAGEIEHCADYKLAWQNSMARYAAVVNDLAARRKVFANHAAASKHIKRIVGPHPDDWLTVFHCLLNKSGLRDGSWHKPRIVPGGKPLQPRMKDDCKFMRAYITDGSLPEVGKHASVDLIKDCNEGPPAKKGGAQTTSKPKAAPKTPPGGAEAEGRIGAPAASATSSPPVVASRIERAHTVSRLPAHERVHVVRPSRGNGADPVVHRQPAGPPCTVRRPEDCATFELWLLNFRALPTFESHEGIPPPKGGRRSGFDVLGDRPASRDQNATPARRPAKAVGPRLGDRFIDHPTDRWVRDNLPENLRVTAYQLPADCADIVVILRHVYLSAHQRTEWYGDWLVGDALGRAAQEHIGGAIAEAKSANLERVLNPYLDASGQPIRAFAQLEPLLHPGDQLVWDHHANGLSKRRTGGHGQTIMDIARDAGGSIQRIDVLQGNQPIAKWRTAEIITQVDRERVAAGRPPLPESETKAGGPLAKKLHYTPGRRIEVGHFERSEIDDVTLPSLTGSAAPPQQVWTWGDDDDTILAAAGPPRSAPRPATGGRGGARAPRISDWLGELRVATTNRLHGVFEAALHEARAAIDGGATLPATDASDLGVAAGERLWNRARLAVGRLVAFGRRRGDLDRGDAGERVHFEALHRMRAMIRALGGIDPPAYHGNPSAAATVRTTFQLIDTQFDFAARGGDDIGFTRRVRRGGQLVRVLITGFDPFDPAVRGPPPAGSWNPSGAAVLSMDGTDVPLAGRDVAAIEGVVFPVSFAQFRAGIVERAVRRAGPAVDAVISVSLDPNLASTEPVRIEQFAVGVHAQDSIRPHRLFATETVAQPGLRAVTPGGAPIVESNIDVAAIAAETAGRERRRFVPRVAAPDIGREITLRFSVHEEAVRAARALGAAAPASGTDLVLDDEAVVRALMATAAPASAAPGANAEITFTARNFRFRAVLVRGPGGSFLSNEVFYRIRTAIDRAAGDAVSFHVHSPGGAPIPRATGTHAQRATRRAALAAARDVVVTLVATLRRAVAAVGRHTIAARSSGGGTP